MADDLCMVKALSPRFTKSALNLMYIQTYKLYFSLDFRVELLLHTRCKCMSYITQKEFVESLKVLLRYALWLNYSAPHFLHQPIRGKIKIQKPARVCFRATGIYIDFILAHYIVRAFCDCQLVSLNFKTLNVKLLQFTIKNKLQAFLKWNSGHVCISRSATAK